MTILENLKSRAEACFLCGWIACDIAKHGQMTNWSPADGPLALSPAFPKGAKALHIRLEMFSIDNIIKSSIVSVD